MEPQPQTKTKCVSILGRLLMRAAGADCTLAAQATPHSRWLLYTSGVSLLIAVPVNVAGFFCLILAATGWRSDLWPEFLAIAIVVAVLIYIMDARGTVAATYAIGWRHAFDRNLFGSAPTSPPESARAPLRVRIAFSIVMGLASMTGLVLGLLHGDIEPAQQQGATEINKDAIKSATDFVAVHLDDSKKLRSLAEEEVASVNDIGPDTGVEKQPIVAQVKQLSNNDATLSARLTELRETRSRAQTLMECEKRGGDLPGCTGHPGELEAWHQASKIFNGADAEIKILTPQYEATHSEFVETKQTLQHLQAVVNARLLQARADVLSWEQQSYGKPFERLVRQQPSYREPGTSLISQLDAFFILAASHRAAVLTTLLLLNAVLLAIDLVNLIGVRAWPIPNDYAVGLVLKTERAMQEFGEQFQLEHQPILRARDAREQETIDLSKRHRQRTFEEANADAALKAALHSLSDHPSHDTTH